MALISLKDYAVKNGVTYEAVRQQVVRYANELGEHIIKDGRQQFLDDKAVVFLDEKRRKNPVSIIQANKDEEIERLKKEKENLLIKIATQADKIAELSDWKADKAVLIAQAEQQALLLEEKTNLAIKHAEDVLKNKLQEEFEQELTKIREELEIEKQKTWLQKLLKKRI